LIQDKVADWIEVRKVELASTIMDELQEGAGSTAQRQWVRQVASIGKYSDPPHSLNRTGLKADARKVLRKWGDDRAYMRSGADLVKGARRSLRKSTGHTLNKEESLVEGGPTRKHFQQVADLIKEIPDPAKRKELAQHHAGIFKGQNPRFDHARFYKAAGVNEEVLDEVLSSGAKQKPVQPSIASLNRNVMTNIRRAVQTLRVKNVNPATAAAGHRDFSKLASKNPKAPGYMLLRKLAPAKAQAVQSLSQAGVPLGQALDASPVEFSQALQRIKRFK
jgi:DNA primase